MEQAKPKSLKGGSDDPRRLPLRVNRVDADTDTDGSEAMSGTVTVPFVCPLCGDETTAELLAGAIMATPHEPTIRCECGAEWRLNLYCTNEGDRE